ncbi:MAG: MiaB/RimO family radical SAM methylthiotransferase [Chloroflexi bacterium]|nr:MAG: MiaB/RimO family radical SAM methylthiotransferase [Chloroflexota bacterium]
MKVFLNMVGCRLNQSEIETFARQFRSAGHTIVAVPDDADLVVVNTCAVTAGAASDSRQKIRQAARSGAKEIIATGCWATINPSGASALPGVTQIIDNASKDNLVLQVLQLPADTFDLEPVEREPLPGARARTRAFIKVQDGCNNRCTFCITTIARGQGRSRAENAVVADVRAALAGGAQEVVLTGVHLGSWGHDSSPSLHLADLIRTILVEADPPRLRLSSLEPWDLNEDFFSLWEDSRLCRHLHLPLQSGCAATLRRMARKTTPESFAQLVESARKQISGVAVTTDVIAGFPGETEMEFAETLAFVQIMSFAGGHVFTYSARQGTAAARMPDQVPHPIRKERNAILRGALADSAQAYRKAFIEQELPVLWESTTGCGPHGWEVTGLTDNYIKITAVAPKDIWNTIHPVRLKALTADGMKGLLVENA